MVKSYVVNSSYHYTDVNLIIYSKPYIYLTIHDTHVSIIFAKEPDTVRSCEAARLRDRPERT